MKRDLCLVQQNPGHGSHLLKRSWSSTTCSMQRGTRSCSLLRGKEDLKASGRFDGVQAGEEGEAVDAVLEKGAEGIAGENRDIG